MNFDTLLLVNNLNGVPILSRNLLFNSCLMVSKDFGVMEQDTGTDVLITSKNELEIRIKERVWPGMYRQHVGKMPASTPRTCYHRRGSKVEGKTFVVNGAHGKMLHVKKLLTQEMK